MLRLMGGMFGLEQRLDLTPQLPPFLQGRVLLLANARSGLALVAQHLTPARVWLPSYVCASVLDALAGFRPAFYPVDYGLRLGDPRWLDDLRTGDLVVLVDYFGFPSDRACAERARARGAWVLEDACQALLTEGLGQAADFVLLSPRKFLGVPDGGLVRVQGCGTLPDIERQPLPAAWWLKALQASILRWEFDRHGGERHWFELFQETEASAPIGPYAMSELSAALLRQSVDYQAISSQRRENYRFLLERLGDIALYGELPAQVVPLGFPVRVRGRDALQRCLFADEIYPAVHWPIQGVVPEEFRDSHRLAAEVITLPCDQRYGPEDMERMARSVKKALSEQGVKAI